MLPLVLFSFAHSVHQLYYVPIPITRALQTPKMPFQVSGAGRVNAIQKDMHTFTMSILQPLNGAMNAHLTIRGILGLNKNRSLHLPSRGAVIAFSGQFVAFEEMVTQVAIERISYLPTPVPASIKKPRFRRPFSHLRK